MYYFFKVSFKLFHYLEKVKSGFPFNIYNVRFFMDYGLKCKIQNGKLRYRNVKYFLTLTELKI